MSTATPVVDAEDVLKLFSLYLTEHGEKLLSRAHQFMNVTHIYPYTTPSSSLNNNNIGNNNTKEPLRITHDFLKISSIDPHLMNDYDKKNSDESNVSSSSITNSSSSSSSTFRDTLEVEKSIIERWWERRKKIHSEWVDTYLQNNGIVSNETSRFLVCNLISIILFFLNENQDKSPFALDENPQLTMISNIYFHHLMNKLRYDSLFGMVNQKMPNSKILKMKYKILRILNARVKEFKRKQKEKKSFFSWFVEQIVDNEFITELTNTDFERFIYIFKNVRVLQLETNKTKKSPMQSNKTEDVEVDLTLFHNLKHLVIRSNFTRLLYIKGRFITNEDTLRVLNLISIDEQLLFDIFVEPDIESMKEFSERSRDVFRVLEILNISNVWFKKGEVPSFFSKPAFIDLLVNKLKVFILKNTNLEISIFDTFNDVGKHFVLSHLMVLNLSHNNLHTILRKKDNTEEKNCVTINLPNLIELNLGFNELESLDSFHGITCPKLEIINLEDNKLTQDIAENLRRLTANSQPHLKRINLRTNQLTSWQEIKQLQFFNKLHNLQLSGNEEICKYGNYHKTILAYFRRNIVDEFFLDGVKYLKKDIADILNLSQTGSSTATDTSSQNGSLSDTDGSDADIENDNFVDLRKQIKKSSSSKSLVQEEVKEKKKKKEGKNKKSKKKKKRVFNEIPEYKKDSPSKVVQSNPEEDAKKVKEEFPELEERSSKVIELLSQLRNDGGTKWLSLLNEMGYLDEKNQQISLTPNKNLTDQLKKTTQNKDKQELEDFMNKLKKNSTQNKAMNSLSDFLLGKIKKKNHSSSGDVAATPRAKNHQQDFFSSMDMNRISRLGNKQMPVLEVHPIFGIADTPNFEKYGATEVSGISFMKSKGTKYGSDALISKSLNLGPRNDFLNVSLVVNQSIFKYGDQAKSESNSDSDKRSRIQKRHRNIKQTYSAKLAVLKDLENTENENSLKITDAEIQSINSSRKRNKGVFLRSELEQPEAKAAVGSMINKRATVSLFRRKDTVKQATETKVEKKFSVPVPEANMQKYITDDDLLESLLDEKDEHVENRKRTESVLRSRGRSFISSNSTSGDRERSATQFNTEPKKETLPVVHSVSFAPIIVPPVALAKATEPEPVLAVIANEPRKDPIEDDDDDDGDDILKELLAKNEEPSTTELTTSQKQPIIPPIILSTFKTPEPTPKTPEKEVINTLESAALQNAITTPLVPQTIASADNANKSDSDFDSFDEEHPKLPGVTPQKLKLIAPFNDMGQSSDSDFGTFSEDDDDNSVPRKKHQKKPPSHDKTNSMPIINLSSEDPKGRSKSKSVFKIFKKKEQEVTQIKNRVSMRIPHEERDFLNSALSGAMEFGPITSSTTFASLKILDENQPTPQADEKESKKEGEDSDFDLTDDEEDEKKVETPIIDTHQQEPIREKKEDDSTIFETNTPTRDESPLQSTPVVDSMIHKEEPKVSPIIEEVSTPSIEPLSTLDVAVASTAVSKKVISNVKVPPVKEKSTTPTTSSPSTSISTPSNRKSFVISSKRKKTVFFSEHKEVFPIETNIIEESEDTSTPEVPQITSVNNIVESYEDPAGYDEEVTTTPVILTTPVVQQVNSSPSAVVEVQQLKVSTPPIETPVLVQEKEIVVPSVVEVQQPKALTPQAETLSNLELVNTPIETPVSPVVVSTLPISPIPEAEEKITTSQDVVESKPVTPTEPIIETAKEEENKTIEQEVNAPETLNITEVIDPIPISTQSIIEIEIEEPKAETPKIPESITRPTIVNVEDPEAVSIIPEAVEIEEVIVKKPTIVPSVSESITEPEIVTETLIIPDMVSSSTIAELIIETTKEEIKEKQPNTKEEPLTIIPQPKTVENETKPVPTEFIPQKEDIKEPENESTMSQPSIIQDQKPFIPETIPTATTSPNKDIAIISPVVSIPSPTIENNDEEQTLKELLKEQQALNEETEYDDEETILPSVSAVVKPLPTAEHDSDEDDVLKSLLKEQQSKTTSQDVEYDDDDEDDADMDSLLNSYTKQRQQETPKTTTTTTTSPTVVAANTELPTAIPEKPTASPIQKVTKTRRNAIGSFTGTTIPTSSRKRSTAVVIPTQRKPTTRTVKTVDDLLMDDSDDE